MCQDNIENKPGRDIYVSRQQRRQIREGYLCVETTLKTNQGGISMCQDNIEEKSGRDICVKTTLKTNQGEISDSINIYLMLLSMSEKTDN